MLCSFSFDEVHFVHFKRKISVTTLKALNIALCLTVMKFRRAMVTVMRVFGLIIIQHNVSVCSEMN